MLIRGVGGLILLTLVMAVAGCDAAPAPARAQGAVAVPAYEAPRQAPGFCTRLAASTHLTRIPTAVGRLVVDPQNAAAVGDLKGAITELRAVLEDLRQDGPDGDLAVNVEELIAAVSAATTRPVDAGLRNRLSARLDVLGSAVQPLCEFPT